MKRPIELHPLVKETIAAIMRPHMYPKVPAPRGHVKGKPLRISVAVQQRYVSHIEAHVDRMIADVHSRIETLFIRHASHFMPTSDDTVGMDATDPSFASQLRILVNGAKSKWDQLFGQLAMGLSPWMADSVNRSSSDTLRMSVSEMPNLRAEGKKLTIDIATLSPQTREILKAAASHSADLIKSIPEEHLNKVAEVTYRSIVSGKGISDVRKALDKMGNTTRNWANNTAMDQTRKLYNALNKGRMQKIGLTKAEWIHSGGSQHPRELHEDFDGQVFNLSDGAPVGDDDGNYVDPGEEPNCRCTMAPVIAFDDDDE
jgi:SPP1 gp7 family putative phage head morphogenesis protein